MPRRTVRLMSRRGLPGPLRPGIAFPHRHAHELAHLAPLIARVQDVLVAPPETASVVVHADTRPPVRGAWNVQVFHGLGDKGYTTNPLFLQRGRFVRARTAANMAMRTVRLPAPFLRAPERPGMRRSRYQQVNAYGPRWADLFEGFLKDAEVSRFGHVALNETAGLESDPDGPVLWLPTWDNRKYLGGVNQSSLEPFADEVVRIARSVPVLVKLHPLTVTHDQSAKTRKRLAEAAGITIAPADADPYKLLQGARAVLTDTSSLGLEAFCSGLPVGLALNPGLHPEGLNAELADRVPCHSPSQPTLMDWAQAPPPPADAGWARDLLFAPAPHRNDEFAATLRSRMTGAT